MYSNPTKLRKQNCCQNSEQWSPCQALLSIGCTRHLLGAQSVLLRGLGSGNVAGVYTPVYKFIKLHPYQSVRRKRWPLPGGSTPGSPHSSSGTEWPKASVHGPETHAPGTARDRMSQWIPALTPPAGTFPRHSPWLTWPPGINI